MRPEIIIQKWRGPLKKQIRFPGSTRRSKDGTTLRSVSFKYRKDLKNSKLVSFPSGGKTIGDSGTRTMGQAVLFKLRMGLTLTQVTKLRKALQGARKNEQIKRKKKDFFKTLMSFITSAKENRPKKK